MIRSRFRLAGAGWRSRLLAAVLPLALLGATATAQDAARRAYDEELRVRLDEQSLAARDTGIDGGGWFTFSLTRFDDEAAGLYGPLTGGLGFSPYKAGGGRVRTLREYQLHLWAAANYEGVHKAYVRGLFLWDDWNHGDNLSGTEDEFQQVERAWYLFSLGQLLANQTGRPPAVDLRVQVGRDYATIGTGFVLALPLDLVQMAFRAPGWEVRGLLAKTIEETPNVDRSYAVADHEDRRFWGVEVTHTGLTHHRPFAYWLVQEDHTSAHPLDPAQAYAYSSRYLGVGSTGSLLLPDLRYQTELVWESGRAFSEGATRQDGMDDICAWAYDALLEYSWRVPTHPQFQVEYMRGSGDGDREGLATSTVGGNRLGTTDHAFNAFGFRDTGVALAPTVANLNIWMGGASFQPLEHVRAFRHLRAGTKVFFYEKAVASGAISDPTATNDSSWVGWEWDGYIDWRITSDLSWTIRYGAFFPGAAYGDNGCRQLLYTGVTLSF